MAKNGLWEREFRKPFFMASFIVKVLFLLPYIEIIKE